MSERIAGRFVLRELIASGGMGKVWHAYDEVLRVDVALKQVKLDATATDAERAKLIARAEHEARNGAKLRHNPNIVAVYDVVIDDGAPWLVMRLIKGRSLMQELEAHTRLRPDEARKIASGVLAALGEAHAEGIVHRDVKPANIMLAEDGTVLLADFGIAKHHTDTTHTTHAMLIGSLLYMSPERLDGRDLPAGDMFALGATLYETVEGVSPFQRDTPTAVMSAIASKKPDPPQHAGDLEELILALLQKDPDERPDVKAAQRMLAAGMGFKATKVEPQPGTTKPETRPTRKTAAAISVALLLIGAAVGSAVLYTTRDKNGAHAGAVETTSPSAAPVRFKSIPDICGNLSGELFLNTLIDYRRPADSKTTDTERECGWTTEQSAPSNVVKSDLTIMTLKFSSAESAESHMQDAGSVAGLFGETTVALGKPGEFGDEARILVFKQDVNKTYGGETYASIDMTVVVFRAGNLCVRLTYMRSRGADPWPEDTSYTRQGAVAAARSVASSLGR